MNLDGRPDLLIGNFSDATASILLNTTPPGAGSVSFNNLPAAPMGGSVRSIAVGDLNSDGRVDFVTADQNQQATVLRLNTPYGAVQFETPSSSAPENAPPGVVVVRDGGTNAGPVQVTASATGGSATPNVDYSGLPAVIGFPNADTSPKNVPLNVANDGVVEPFETVDMSLGNPTVGLGLGSRTTHVHTITDAQCTPRPSPSVAVSPQSSTTVTATLTAGIGTLSQIRIGDATQNPASPSNVRIDIQGGPSGITSNFTYSPPPGTNQVSMTLTRLGGGGVQVPLILTDPCGDWHTFAGAGSGAFGAGGAAQAAGARSAERAGPTLTPGQACASFPNQAAAQAFLRENPTDPRNMDRSRDGIACESADGAALLPEPADRRPVARR